MFDSKDGGFSYANIHKEADEIPEQLERGHMIKPVVQSVQHWLFGAGKLPS